MQMIQGGEGIWNRDIFEKSVKKSFSRTVYLFFYECGMLAYYMEDRIESNNYTYICCGGIILQGR